MPNLLFHGPQGTGKTTVAKIIIEQLKPIDILRINGSDETSVDVIRDKVYNFMTSMSSVSDKPKLIWIEEFDFMSQSAFAALRGMIEQYMKNARFVCTANYLHKIPEPIQSRFSVTEFKKIHHQKVFEKVRDICDQEGINVKDEVLVEIVNKADGDLRTAINIIQQLSANEIKTISELDIDKADTPTETIFKLIKEGKWTQLRFDMANMSPDYKAIFSQLADMFYNDELEVGIKVQVTEVLSDGLVELATSFDPDICAAAVFSRIIKKLGITIS
jgi:DNA polymerase III delta prime subunit